MLWNDSGGVPIQTNDFRTGGDGFSWRASNELARNSIRVKMLRSRESYSVALLYTVEVSYATISRLFLPANRNTIDAVVLSTVTSPMIGIGRVFLEKGLAPASPELYLAPLFHCVIIITSQDELYQNVGAAQQTYPLKL